MIYILESLGVVAAVIALTFLRRKIRPAEVTGPASRGPQPLQADEPQMATAAAAPEPQPREVQAYANGTYSLGGTEHRTVTVRKGDGK